MQDCEMGRPNDRVGCKLINGQCAIRVGRVQFFSEINKRACPLLGRLEHAVEEKIWDSRQNFNSNVKGMGCWILASICITCERIYYKTVYSIILYVYYFEITDALYE